jgi:hypothetical protein
MEGILAVESPVVALMGETPVQLEPPPQNPFVLAFRQSTNNPFGALSLFLDPLEPLDIGARRAIGRVVLAHLMAIKTVDQKRVEDHLQQRWRRCFVRIRRPRCARRQKARA